MTDYKFCRIVPFNSHYGAIGKHESLRNFPSRGHSHLKGTASARPSLGRARFHVLRMAAFFFFVHLFALPTNLQARTQESAPDPQRISALLENIRASAKEDGIPEAFVNSLFRGFRPDPAVIALDSKQAEFVKPFGFYLKRAVSDQRIRNGRKARARHAALLKKIEEKWKVDSHVLLAIWGMESNYGTNQGRFNAPHALATLALGKRRAVFGRKQLRALLRLAYHDPLLLPAKSSWAGALGHMQFTPITYEAYAVDGDGDGRRDMMRSLEDALSSAAAYLNRFGWRLQTPWGFEVRLAKNFSYGLADPDATRSLDLWGGHGVHDLQGQPVQGNDMASLILPAGRLGPAFLVMKNFRTLLRYNRSQHYAVAIGHLADRIGGGAPLSMSSEEADRAMLSGEGIRLLQNYLTQIGFDTKGVDGMMGKKTRRAIRAYQKQYGLPQDGYPSDSLLRKVRKTLEKKKRNS